MSDTSFETLCGHLLGISLVTLGLTVARFRSPADSPVHEAARVFTILQQVMMWATLGFWAVTR